MSEKAILGVTIAPSTSQAVRDYFRYEGSRWMGSHAGFTQIAAEVTLTRDGIQVKDQLIPWEAIDDYWIRADRVHQLGQAYLPQVQVELQEASH